MRLPDDWKAGLTDPIFLILTGLAILCFVLYFILPD